MKFTPVLQVTCDRDGAILSAYRVPEARSGVPLGTGVVTDAAQGIRTFELALPDALAGLELHELAESFRVDVASEYPTLVRTCGHDESAV